MSTARKSARSPYAARRRLALKQAAAQSLLITCSTDVRYMCGFTGEDSFLLIAKGYACLITDGRFDQQAASECPDIDVFVRPGPIFVAVAKILRKHRPRGKLAVQPEHMTLAMRIALEKLIPASRVKPIANVLTAIQEIRDSGEIAAIRKAIKIAEAALLSMMAQGKKAFLGRTERQIAADLEYRMRLGGADGASFPTIVAVGPHAAMPHYRAGNTIVRNGDPLLIDWGAIVNGYCSDLTRVLFIGRIPPKLAEIYEVVLKAQLAAIATIAGGVAAKDADAAARNVIESAGYAKQFVHGLGHGIGTVVHASPGLGKTSRAILKPGMVVTVEPGIYLPRQAGVRIEDDVEVTKKGCRLLSSLPKQLQAMLIR